MSVRLERLYKLLQECDCKMKHQEQLSVQREGVRAERADAKADAWEEARNMVKNLIEEECKAREEV